MLKTNMGNLCAACGIGCLIAAGIEAVFIIKEKIDDARRVDRIKKLAEQWQAENEIEAEATVILIMEEP